MADAAGNLALVSNDPATGGAVVMLPQVGARLALSKHEGSGNDFLVAVDPDGELALSPATARALCDRHRGLGADGVMVARRGSGGTDLSMQLFNADGSEAEMSGNGIRCLVQAAVAAKLVAPGSLTVATGGGTRIVDYREGEHPGTGWASVEMGRVTLGDEVPSPFPGGRARLVSVGNPHVVVIVDVDPTTLDLEAIAHAAADGLPEGANVEVVAKTGEDALELRVYERGVGETQACGTGSCAAAVVASRWGLVGDEVAVDNPGGRLTVTLAGGEDPSVVLSGPVRHVAEIVVDLAEIGVLAPEPAGATVSVVPR